MRIWTQTSYACQRTSLLKKMHTRLNDFNGMSLSARTLRALSCYAHLYVPRQMRLAAIHAMHRHAPYVQGRQRSGHKSSRKVGQQKINFVCARREWGGCQCTQQQSPRQCFPGTLPQRSGRRLCAPSPWCRGRRSRAAPCPWRARVPRTAAFRWRSVTARIMRDDN